MIIILYSLYKLYIENKIKDQFRDSVGNIKNNIEMPKIPTIDERGKSGLNIYYYCNTVNWLILRF